MKISVVDLCVIVIYLIMMMAVGVVFKRFNRNANDFVRSGCRATWWLVGASCFMSTFSAWTFTGGAGVAYLAGWSFTIIFIMNALGFLIQGLFLAPWCRQLRAISLPEIIRRRFNVTTQQFIAYLELVGNVIGSGITLYGLAVFTSVMVGINIHIIILVLGFVVVFYSFSSGNWAVLATDFIQSIILFPVTLLIAFLALYKVGGLSGLEAKVAAMGLTNNYSLFNTKEFAGQVNDFTALWAIGILIGKLIEFMGLGAAKRYFGVKDGREASKAAFLASGLMLIGAFIWVVPPMVARLFYADKVMASPLANPIEASYATVCLEFLPTGMVGLVLVTMFSATMSSMDTGLNLNSAIIINDVYPALCKRFGKTPKPVSSLLPLAKICTIILGAMIVMLALCFSQLKGVGMFRLMMELTAIFGSIIGVPMLLGMFIKKAPAWSGIVSIAVGAIPSAIGFFSGSSVFSDIPLLATPWTFQTRVFMNVAVTSAAFLLTMPFYRPSEKYKQQVDEFFTTMKTPVDFEKEVGGSVDISQLIIIGGFTMITGVLINLLHFVPGLSTADRYGIIFVSTAIMLTGLFLYIAGKRSYKTLQSTGKSDSGRITEENLIEMDIDMDGNQA